MLTNGCEGPDGTTVTLANSGVSGDAWTLTASITGGTCTYSTSGQAHGDSCMAVTTGSTSGAERRGWSVNAANSASTQWFRFYLDPASVVGTVSPLRGMNAGSTGQRFRVQVSAGVVTLLNNSSATVWTSSALTAGTKWRIEASIQGSTTGQGRVWIYPLDSTTAAQDSGVVTANWGGPIREIWFGQTNSAFDIALKLDDCGWSDTAALGPARTVIPASSTATVAGRTSSSSVAARTSSASVSGRTSTPEVSHG